MVLTEGRASTSRIETSFGPVNHSKETVAKTQVGEETRTRPDYVSISLMKLLDELVLGAPAGDPYQGELRDLEV